MREALGGMRKDQLLAAGLAPCLDGLLAVVKSAESASSVVLAKPMGKVLRDIAADVARTPAAPRRIVRRRAGAGGMPTSRDMRHWLVASPSRTFVAQGAAPAIAESWRSRRWCR